MTPSDFTAERKRHRCYLRYNDPDDQEKLFTMTSSSPTLVGSKTTTAAVAAVAEAAATHKSNSHYVYRKMCPEEFEVTMKTQKLAYDLKKPSTGEKWISESIEHSKGFKAKDVCHPVVEFQVKKVNYMEIRNDAIPQFNSKIRQNEAGGRLFNITNNERIKEIPDKLNLGLKGEKNVDMFNEHIISIEKVNPNSWVNKNKILRWIRKNKLKTACAVIGIVINATCITLSFIKDNGTFGESTQITFGQIAGGSAGAKIGAAIGSILPGLGTVLFGLLGSVIGSLIGEKIIRLGRYLFCAAPVSPGLGPPILDTDPTPTAKGVPQTDYCCCDSVGVPDNGLSTGAFGVPSLGLDTGASGLPTPDYEIYS